MKFELRDGGFTALDKEGMREGMSELVATNDSDEDESKHVLEDDVTDKEVDEDTSKGIEVRDSGAEHCKEVEAVDDWVAVDDGVATESSLSVIQDGFEEDELVAFVVIAGLPLSSREE